MGEVKRYGGKAVKRDGGKEVEGERVEEEGRDKEGGLNLSKDKGSEEEANSAYPSIQALLSFAKVEVLKGQLDKMHGYLCSLLNNNPEVYTEPIDQFLSIFDKLFIDSTNDNVASSSAYPLAQALTSFGWTV